MGSAGEGGAEDVLAAAGAEAFLPPRPGPGRVSGPPNPEYIMIRRLTVPGLLALLVTLLALPAAAQENPRFGVWQLQSDAPPPAKNIMTYEPWGDGGMKITVASTNARGEENVWGYATLFDGVFRPVDGQEGAETAVEIVDDRTTRISNARNGRVYQVIINVLSEDGNTILNDYVRMDEDGKITRVTRAEYRRIR